MRILWRWTSCAWRRVGDLVRSDVRLGEGSHEVESGRIRTEGLGLVRQSSWSEIFHGPFAGGGRLFRIGGFSFPGGVYPVPYGWFGGVPSGVRHGGLERLTTNKRVQ